MTKMHHVAVFVSHMNRNLHLFRDILGFEVAWHMREVKGRRMSRLLGIPDLKLEMAYLKTGDGCASVELCRMIHPEMGRPSQTFGVSGTVSLSFKVTRIESIHERLTDEGWQPFSPCMDMRDPEGNSVKLFCFPIEKGVVIELIEYKDKRT